MPENNPKTANNWAYTDIVKDHFLNPRNFIMGDESAWQADGEGLVGNPVCGDQMLVKIRVQDGNIKDIGWKSYGCASALASTSALSELAQGRTFDEADHITAKEICDYLGGLPEHKFHCSVLGHQALHQAILDYKKKKASAEA